MDEGLELGYRWLKESEHAGTRVVVLNAKKMLNNRPTLANAGQFHVVSPLSASAPRPGPVLAIWPNPEALELAQRLALDAALCVIPYTHDVTWWIARTGAVNLTAPDAEPPELATLDPAVTAALDFVLSDGGHNGFLGGGEKVNAVRELRSMVSAGHHPGAQDVEEYALSSGETDVDGAHRLRGFYEAILAGRPLRDRGRTI